MVVGVACGVVLMNCAYTTSNVDRANAIARNRTTIFFIYPPFLEHPDILPEECKKNASAKKT
jgi:hypothetical protein